MHKTIKHKYKYVESARYLDEQCLLTTKGESAKRATRAEEERKGENSNKEKRASRRNVLIKLIFVTRWKNIFTIE